jgi:hypothetical protein
MIDKPEKYWKKTDVKSLNEGFKKILKEPLEKVNKEKEKL